MRHLTSHDISIVSLNCIWHVVCITLYTVFVSNVSMLWAQVEGSVQEINTLQKKTTQDEDLLLSRGTHKYKNDKTKKLN